ncbi:MAG: thioredoxin family protein [Nannocystaceae bacterium]|nr:thioredoxin family protein [Nannocystaceae bacterium]
MRNGSGRGTVVGFMLVLRCVSPALLAALLLVLPSACGSKDASAPVGTSAGKDAAAKQKAEPEAAAAKPGVQDDGSVVSAVAWFHGSLDEALAEAKKEGKLVFVDVGAYWCPPCQRLDEEVFTEAAVGEALRAGYVALHIDAEKGEGPDVVREYHVQAYPSLLVLESGGMEKGRVVDFLPAAELLSALRRIEAGENVLADAVAQVEAKPDDVALRQRLGHLYVLAGQREQANVEYEQVLEADPTNEMGLSSKVLYDQALFIQFKLDDDAPGAIAALRKLQSQFPDSAEAIRAYRQIGRMLSRQEKPDEAIAELDAMLAMDPTDVGLASSYGWFCFRQRCKPARGLKVVRAALETEPKNADLRYLEAELAELTGDRDAARVAIRRALDIEPGSAFFRRQVDRFEASP